MAVMTIIPSNMYLLLLLCFIDGSGETEVPKQIPLGSSLSPTTHPTSWLSPSGQFAFGFYQQGNGFAIGIWLIGEKNTVVWTANRNDPPVISNAKLQLTMDGNLLLQREEGEKMVISNATASFASMLDTGNFVLYNKSFGIIWQSFDYPTDSILSGQILPPGGKLFSGISETNLSTGRFHLVMQKDGNLVLYPTNTGDTPWDAYWASNTDGFNYYLLLNTTAASLPLLTINNNKSEVVRNLCYGSSLDNNLNRSNAIYRATLDPDGVLRLYAHVYDDKSKPQVSKVCSVLNNPCDVKTFCGFNSYCTFNDNQPYCNCIPGTDFIDPNHRTLGCKRNFSEAECRGGKENANLYSMSKIDSISWGDRSYIAEKMSEDDCQSSCLEDCNCGAALFEENLCKKQELPLRYLIRESQSSSSSSSSSSTIFFKVGNKGLKSWNDTPPISDTNQPPPIKTTSNKAIVHIIIVILVFAFLLCSIIAISIHLLHKIRVLSYKRLLEIGDLGLNEGIITLRVFSYNELKRATNGFKEELGKGSFGAVYKGTLNKGRRVIAVKRLEKLVEEGEREFRAEMRAIGKAHHRNLVRLLGYCAEGSKRLLVYEYMSNGSLGQLIFGDVIRPYWDERRRIALDVARGILYLHEECEAPIIHCDIKPQNILVDEFKTAKISDFGLAKLLMPDQTRTFTGVRGTRGYVAPEWQTNTPISVKVDVYSYGIVLLEILFCRRNLEVNVLEPEQVVLSNWVYKCFVSRELNKLVPREEVDYTVLENMVKVGLWCIQDEPFLRPTMKSVILMLEGVTDVAIPPCPSANSM